MDVEEISFSANPSSSSCTAVDCLGATILRLQNCIFSATVPLTLTFPRPILPWVSYIVHSYSSKVYCNEKSINLLNVLLYDA
jgi:hypothetical protein